MEQNELDPPRTLIEKHKTGDTEEVGIEGVVSESHDVEKQEEQRSDDAALEEQATRRVEISE